MGDPFPITKDLKFDGLPDDFQPELSITFDFASAYNPPKDSRVYDLPRNLKELNPTTNVPPGQIGGSGAAGHSAVDVQVSARGPGAGLFGGVQDNTQIFFKILRALGER